MVRELAATKRRNVKSQDEVTREFFRLAKAKYPGIPDEIEKVVYRKPYGGINARIIDPSFATTYILDRDELLADIFAQMPPEFERDLGILLLITPEEAKGVMHHMTAAFNNPFNRD